MSRQLNSRNRVSIARRMIGWGAVGSAAAAVLVGVTVAPPDAVQGEAARLIYLHVPAAWTAYLAFALVLIASTRYLWSRDLRWDGYAGTAAEIGVVMTVLTIVIGSVWGRAVWGVWWAWDPRLVSTVMMLLVYTGYLAVRRIGGDPADRGRRAARLGIGGASTIPIVHFSVIWWRSLHQPATLLAPSVHPPIDGLMAAALGLAVIAFTLLAAWLFLWRDQAPTIDGRRAPVSTGVSRSRL